MAFKIIFHFEIISDVHKNYTNKTKNSCISFTQIFHLLIFYHICILYPLDRATDQSDSAYGGISLYP